MPLFRKKELIGRFDFFFASPNSVYISDKLPSALTPQVGYLESQLNFCVVGMFNIMTCLDENLLKGFALTVSAQISALGAKKKIKRDLNIPLGGIFCPRPLTYLTAKPEGARQCAMIFRARGRLANSFFAGDKLEAVYYRSALEAYVEHLRRKLNDDGDLVVSAVASVIHVFLNHHRSRRRALSLLRQLAADLANLKAIP